MKTNFRKVAALLLSLCMIFSCLSISVSATDAEETVPVLTRVEMFIYEPVVGQTIPQHYSPTVQTVPAADYSVEGSWLVSSDGENFDYIMEEKAAFEEGKYYAFVIGAGGGEYVVNEDTEMYLNGKVYSEQEIKVGDYYEYASCIYGPLVAGEAAAPLLEEIYIESYLPMMGDPVSPVFYIYGKTIPACDYKIAGNWFVSMDGENYTLTKEGDVFEQGGFYALGMLGTEGSFFTDENTKMFLDGEEFSYKTILVDGVETNVLFIIPCLGSGGGGDDFEGDCEHTSRDFVCVGEKTHSPFCMDCGYVFTDEYEHADDDDNGYCDYCGYEMVAQGGGGYYVSQINVQILDPVIGEEIYSSYTPSIETVPEDAIFELYGMWLESIDGKNYRDIEYPSEFKAGYYYAFAFNGSGGRDWIDENTTILINGEALSGKDIIYDNYKTQVPYIYGPYASDTPCAEHRYEEHVIPANCTDDGYTRHICVDCGDTYDDNIVEADPNLHNYTELVVEPTCVSRGYTEHTCTYCGDSYKDNYTDAQEYAHQYKVIETVEAGEAQFGYDIIECIFCGIQEYVNFIYPTDENINYEFGFEFRNEGIYINSYSGSDTTVTIPATYYGAKVCGFGFSDNYSITDIIISEGIEEVNSHAFSNCGALVSVMLPTTIKKIGYGAFSGCSALKTISFPGGIVEIQDNAFSECMALDQITLPVNLETIGSYVFNNCAALQSIVVPENVSKIGSHAFANCSSLATAQLPQKLTAIPSGLFANCTELSDINLGKSIKTIGKEAFESCHALVKIEVPDSVTTISNNAFRYASSLETVVLGNSVRTIGDAAFADCVNLSAINIPNSVRKIGDTAFASCNQLVEMDLSGVTTLGEEVFRWCGMLKTVTLPSRMKTIPRALFASCGALESIELPSGITKIEREAFEYCSSLRSVNIPDGVEIIEKSAFEGCYSLENIKLPDSLVEIGDSVFENCHNLRAITLPNALETIGSFAFYNIYMQAIYIPESVVSLGDWFIGEDATEVTLYYGGSEEEFALIEFYPECNENIVNFVYDFDVEACEHKNCYEYWQYGEGCLDDTIQVTTCYVCGVTETVNHGPQGHDFVLQDWVEPTCTEGGYEYSTCWRCGETNNRVLEALGHNYHQSGYTEPTCTEDGSAHYSCERCGDSYSETIAATGHNIYTNTIPANCIDGGYTFCWCDSCGINYQTDITEALGHAYSTEIIEPTCTQQGYTIYNCDRCGDSYWGDYTDFAEHNWETSVVEPSCMGQGYTIYTCPDCGVNKTDDYVNPTGHNYTVKDYTAEDCENSGTIYYYCDGCGDSYTETVAAKGHNYVAGEIIAPTTTTEGYTIYTCANCGAVEHRDIKPVIAADTVQNMQIVATDTDITVTWDAYPGAVLYNLYVYNSALERLILRPLAADTTSVTLSWPEELEWGETYMIGIKPQTTKWLTTNYMYSALQLGNRLVDVTVESEGRGLRVNWQAYEGATTYYVFVYNRGMYGIESPVSRATVYTNTARITNGISSEVDYEVRVAATGTGLSQKIAEAMPIDARLTAYAPEKYTERGITPTKVAFSWEEIKGADYYWAYLTPVDGGETIVKEARKAVTSVSGLTPNTTYEVQILARVIDSNGVEHFSGKSQVLATITTSDWEDITLTATANESGVVLDWNAHTNAVEYQIYRATDGTFKKIATVTDGNTMFVDESVVVGTTYTYAIKVKVTDDLATLISDYMESNRVSITEDISSDMTSSSDTSSSTTSNVSSSYHDTSSSVASSPSLPTTSNITSSNY